MATVCLLLRLLTAESRGHGLEEGPAISPGSSREHLFHLGHRSPPARMPTFFPRMPEEGGLLPPRPPGRGACSERTAGVAKVNGFPWLVTVPRPRRSDSRTRRRNPAGRKNSVEHGPLAVTRRQTARMRTRGNGPSDMVYSGCSQVRSATSARRGTRPAGSTARATSEEQ